jgi:cell division protease FtsH
MEPKHRTFSIGYFVVVMMLMLIAQALLFAPHAENLSYSEFKVLVKKGKVSDLTLDKQTIRGTLAPEGLESLLPKDKVEELKRSGGGTHRFVTARVDDPGLVGLVAEPGSFPPSCLWASGPSSCAASIPSRG